MKIPPVDICLCKRHATGLGIGSPIKWLCTECALLASDLARVRNFDAYEELAVGDCIDKIGEWLGTIEKTDLSEFTEDEQRLLVTIAVQEFGDSIRRRVRSGAAPF